LLVDTLGLVITVVVHSAGLQDREGAKLVAEKLKPLLPQLTIIWADQGYAGKLVAWIEQLLGIHFKIVKRPPKHQRRGGFEPLPKRWIVERTFAWLDNYRRLSKDYEYSTEVSEAMIRLAMIHVMVRRLCPKRGF
jgi:putative transposase